MLARYRAWPGAEMLSRKIDARKLTYLSFAKFTSLEYALYGSLRNCAEEALARRLLYLSLLQWLCTLWLYSYRYIYIYMTVYA